MITSVGALPGLLQSAEQTIRNGIAQEDRGAGEIAQGTTGAVDDRAGQLDTVSHMPSASMGDPPADPLLQGIMDSIQAQVQVDAGAALVHVYNRTLDDLFSLLSPNQKQE